ncbi:hypothetical protein AGMMS49975_29540 [Clostridia bacterium]|nr:hypothetical protein AGMMS49975_29540 [Clostridia bacterium]
MPELLKIERKAEINYIYYLDGGVIANITNAFNEIVFVHLDINKDGTVAAVSNGD